MAESSFQTRFSEVSFEEMLQTAYVDACTTQFYFHKLFLAFSFLTCCNTFEEDSNGMDVPSQKVVL
jgi:hypothetical protein